MIQTPFSDLGSLSPGAWAPPLLRGQSCAVGNPCTPGGRAWALGCSWPAQKWVICKYEVLDQSRNPWVVWSVNVFASHFIKRWFTMKETRYRAALQAGYGQWFWNVSAERSAGGGGGGGDDGGRRPQPYLCLGGTGQRCLSRWSWRRCPAAQLCRTGLPDQWEQACRVGSTQLQRAHSQHLLSGLWGLGGLLCPKIASKCLI